MIWFENSHEAASYSQPKCHPDNTYTPSTLALQQLKILYHFMTKCRRRFLRRRHELTVTCKMP